MVIAVLKNDVLVVIFDKYIFVHKYYEYYKTKINWTSMQHFFIAELA